jgi:hypothetical protein
MPGDIDYAREKYSTAVHIMATSHGTMRERLLLAYRDSAMRAHPPMPGMGPAISDELSNRIEQLDDRMTRTPAVGDEGDIEATVNAMTEPEVDAASEELVNIAFALLWESREPGHK